MREDATSNRVREAMERGRDYERRRILNLIEDIEWAASISPNGGPTVAALGSLKAQINLGGSRTRQCDCTYGQVRGINVPHECACPPHATSHRVYTGSSA